MDQPTKWLAHRNTSIQSKNVQEYVRHFYSCFLTSQMLKNWKNEIWDKLTDQLAYYIENQKEMFQIAVSHSWNI